MHDGDRRAPGEARNRSVGRVLHLSHTDIATDSRILKCMAAAKDAGYSVTGIGVSDSGGVAAGMPLSGVYVVSVRLLSNGLSVISRHLANVVKPVEYILRVVGQGIRLKPSIIHCNDVSALPAATLLKILTGAALVYDAHELESDRNGLPRWAGRIVFTVERFLWRFVDGLIVVSPSIERWYLRAFCAKRSAVVLNSPHVPTVDAYDNQYLRRTYRIPDGKPIFIYVGVIGSGRGITHIIEAFRGLEDVAHVVFLGYGEQIPDVKVAEKVYSNIHFHQRVDHADVVSIVRSAHGGLCLIEDVSLSDRLSLPNKLFEYAFAGIPVLASDFPEIRDVVSAYRLGECVAVNVPEIQRVIRRWNESHFPNPELLAAGSRIEELAWPAQAIKLVGLYRALPVNR